MEMTWSKGLEQRRARRAEKQLDFAFLDTPPSTKAGGLTDSLPVISPKTGAGAAATQPLQRSPQFTRRRPAGGGVLGVSSSEPALPFKKKKGYSPANRAAFLERQYKHSSIQARKDLSTLHKQLISDAKAFDNIEFNGSKGVEGFRHYLEKKFGSVVAGWRALDREKTGRLSFYEFCNACRSMGYHGNIKHLWDQLDVNRVGAVSLMEIDGEVGHYISTFKLACIRKWGDLLTAWRKGIDIEGAGRVEEPEVAKALSVLGLDSPPHLLSSKKLYNMLRSGPKNMGMSLMDFDPDAWNRWITGDFKAAAQAEPADDRADGAEEGSQDGKAAAKVTRSLSEARNPISERAPVFKVGMHTVDGFKAALVARCGSLLSAWREALDLDGNGRITFCEFCQAMHRLGFQAETRGLWRQLDSKNEGKVLFRDLDPETDAALTELQRRCEEAHGNMLLAWLKELDTKGTGIVNEPTFARACDKLGYSGSAKKLFQVMQPDINRKFITLRDFDTKAFLALSRGDFRMLSEQPDENRKTMLQKNFMERQEGGWFFQIRKAWEMARREEFAKACKMEQEYDFVIDTPEQFEELCIRRFGSLMGAWRQVIDWDSNGRITFSEFCNALRRLGYAGNYKGLWRSYDKDGNGHISLKEMDPETDALISSFQGLLTQRYATIDAAWALGFGKDPHDSCDLRELKQVCEELGYEGDVRKLFDTLQLMPGRALITIWDLDPTCNRKRQRGDVRFCSEPRLLTTGGARRRQHSASSGEEEDGLGPLSLLAASEEGAGEHSIPNTSTSSMKCSPELHNLRVCLRIKYGSTVAAWRAALDPDMQGTASFGKFILVLEDCGFTGNIKGLWEELTVGRSSVTLADIDADACRLLDRFRTQLLDGHGSLVQGWDALDVDGAGRLDEADFTAACNRLGLALRTPKKVFQLLRARLGQRSLTREDLLALLPGLPPEDRAVAWSGRDGGAGAGAKAPGSAGAAAGGAGGGGGEGEPARADGEAQEPASEGEIAQRLARTISFGSSSRQPQPWSPQPDPSSPKAQVQKVAKEHHDKDFTIATLDNFRRMLVVKNGSLFAAWRHCLDVDRNGVVTQQDFAAACRSLGVKNVQQLWAQLDENKDGQISLKEMDPEAADLFGELERLLLETHGSTREGWRKVFLHTGCSWCEQETFVEQCKSLGFQGSAERLFQLVRPEAGRRYLTYEDLWLNLDPNLNRPESPMDWWMRRTSSSGAQADSPKGAGLQR